MIDRRIFAVIMLIIAMPAFASDISHKIAQQDNSLKKLDHKIQGLKETIITTSTQKNSLENDLGQIETNMGSITNDVTSIQKKMALQNRLLAALNQKRTAFEGKLQQQQYLLSEQIRLAYILGQHQQIKIFLNEENPENISRYLNYLNYMDQTRLQLIKQIHTTLSLIQKNQNKIAVSKSKLDLLVKEQNQDKRKLEHELISRRKILESLSQQILNSKQKLETLLNNRNALEQLILKLKNTQRLEQIPKISFAQMKGKLNWPTQGKIISHFNEPIDNTEMHSEGVLINAAEGDPVNAIYPGKIIFANWLRGLGLLIIIDHGQGYLSLYGHNQNLISRLGQFVGRGETIATVGHSGGYQQSALYFQLRHNKELLNPEAWCKD